MRISAFQALRPPADIVQTVSSPPYDTLDAEEARKLIESNEKSFLRIVKPDSDMPRGSDPYSRQVYRHALENLREFQNKGLLVRDEEPSTYVYRLRMGNHVQTGCVACAHIKDYEQKIIRRHEKTLADKEYDRLRLLDAVSAHTGIVFMIYRDDTHIQGLVDNVSARQPDCSFTTEDGIEHTVWKTPQPADFVSAFNDVPACYVADGHHRAAAAVRAGIEEREANPNHTGGEPYNWFPVALFPADQVCILPYHRVVRDLNGMTPYNFLQKVRERFNVTENADPAPKEPRRVSMYLAGKWYGLTWQACPTRFAATNGDPVGMLDVTVLQEQLLEPLLGIVHYHSEPRIDFVGGIKGPAELVRRVDAGGAAVAFSMFPVTARQMMDVADAGRIMPPKSTWFEPKMRSGLFVHAF